MKIGFISNAFPVDLRTHVFGLYKRMGMFIDAMKEMGELDMLFFVSPELTINEHFTAEMEKRLANHWNAQLRLDLCNSALGKQPKGRWDHYVSPALSISNHPPYWQTAQEKHVSAVCRLLSRKPDILFVHRLISFTPVLLSHARLPRTFFDLDDIEHISFRRSIKQPPWYPEKLLLYLRLPMVMFWEQRAVRLSHKTFVCSENDRNYLSKIFCSKKIAVIPNAIDVHDAVEPSDKPRLLFLGQMSYYPNRMAADYLINSIWPAVFSALPDARLLIAGSGHESLAGFASSPPGVEFLGFVDDLETLYKKATVVCCPILYGGGTRIKILEAAAYGRPVVSTTVGAEGIDLRAEEEILLRDTPGSFAEACIRLLKDRNLTVQIGQAARSAVSEKYGRNNAVNAIRSYLGGPGLSA